MTCHGLRMFDNDVWVIRIAFCVHKMFKMLNIRDLQAYNHVS